jgi:hypothetical protein
MNLLIKAPLLGAMKAKHTHVVVIILGSILMKLALVVELKRFLSTTFSLGGHFPRLILSHQSVVDPRRAESGHRPHSNF